MTKADELRELMEEISEDCWCAAWLNGLEYDLWARAQGTAPRSYGMGEVSEAEVARLRQLSEEAGGWWHWPESADDPVFIALADWKAQVH